MNKGRRSHADVVTACKVFLLVCRRGSKYGYSRRLSSRQWQTIGLRPPLFSLCNHACEDSKHTSDHSGVFIAASLVSASRSQVTPSVSIPRSGDGVIAAY